MYKGMCCIRLHATFIHADCDFISHFFVHLYRVVIRCTSGTSESLVSRIVQLGRPLKIPTGYYYANINCMDALAITATGQMQFANQQQ